MKVRNNFVTNSSSSSFIVAKKKDVSEEELVEKVKETYFEKKEKFLQMLKEAIEYWDLDDDIEDDYYGEQALLKAYVSKDEEKIDEEFVKFLTKKIQNIFSDKWGAPGELDSWQATVFEASNEDEDIFSLFMYDNPNIIENDIIKIL